MPEPYKGELRWELRPNSIPRIDPLDGIYAYDDAQVLQQWNGERWVSILGKILNSKGLLLSKHDVVYL